MEFQTFCKILQSCLNDLNERPNIWEISSKLLDLKYGENFNKLEEKLFTIDDNNNEPNNDKIIADNIEPISNKNEKDKFAMWYIDSKSYYNDLIKCINASEKEILIAGWMLSPNIFLQRNPNSNSFIEILKKALARGVKIKVLLWRNIMFQFGSEDAERELLKLAKLGLEIFRHPFWNEETNNLNNFFETQVIPSLKNQDFPTFIDKIYDIYNNKYNALGDLRKNKELLRLWTHHQKL